jgi:hypothetical protein
MFGFASETELYWTNEVRIWSMGLAAVAAIIAAFAGYAQIRLQSIVAEEKAAAAIALQRKSDERIATAQSEAAKAHERIAELSTQAEVLKKDTAEASARAAALDKKAEELRAANLALEAQFQPRRWNTPAEAIAFGAALSKFKGKRVKIASQLGDLEAVVLGQQLGHGLQRGANIFVVNRLSSVAMMGQVVAGVLVSGKDEALVAAILAALPPKLRAARGELPANVTQPFAVEDPPDIDATILVGGKLLPDPP